jgi:hypothetical protein
MSGDLTLSQRVQAYFDSLDSTDDQGWAPGEREEFKEIRRGVSFIVDDVIGSREALTDKQLPGIEKLVAEMPDTVSHFLDDRYTRDVVSAVPGYVHRTMQLSRIVATRKASKITNTYLREATRTFILGLPQACVAMCRASLEQGLKENLSYQESEDKKGLGKLIEQARERNLIDNAGRELAKEVACAGNKVMHAAPADFEKAREVLYKVRGLLEDIYSKVSG